LQPPKLRRFATIKLRIDLTVQKNLPPLSKTIS